jgi:hypothetical protein
MSNLFELAILVILGAAFIFFLAGIFARRRKSRNKASPRQANHRAEDPRPSAESMADLLHANLGHEFPVSTGNAKENDPLIITELVDYVAVEYAVVRHVLGIVGEEYKRSRQRLMHQNNRHIDELVFDVKPSGAADWAGQRRFYFDITAGFDKLGA